MIKGKEQLGRLAMRQEGTMWNAYFAPNETMDSAIFLGGVAMRFIENNEDCRHLFMDLMREAVADIIEENIGVRPLWGGAQAAPEHEKGGSA